MKKQLLVALALTIVGIGVPTTSAALPFGDLNGDGVVNVVDVQLLITLSLVIELSPALDADGDGIPDQYTANTDQATCGGNTLKDGKECVVDQDWLDDMLSASFDDGYATCEQALCTFDACGVCDGDNSTCTGCMDATACNYDATALIGNTTLCQYPASSSVDCAGNCIVAVDCEGVCGGPAAEDACGVCAGDNSTCTGCMDDAACNYDSAAVVDDASLCEYPLSSNVDCDGVCLVATDCAGLCGGTATLDTCGVCGGDNSTCTGCQDMNACNYDGNAIIGDSSLCQYPASSNVNCAGVCLVAVDCAGTCGGSAVPDCKNVCNGTATYDVCGVCGGAGIPSGACNCAGDILDCAGVCGGGATADACGVCNGSNTCVDCAGTPYGSASYDSCGVCNGSNTCVDCAGTPFGSASFDVCGVCGGSGIPSGACNCAGDTTDCSGTCGGGKTVDACGVCGGDNSVCTGCMDAASCSYDATATISDPSACTYPASTLLDCQGNCAVATDCAGVCGGSSSYDDCGVCGGDGTSCVINCTWPGSQAEICPDRVTEYDGMVQEAGPYEAYCDTAVEIATCMPTPDGVDGCFYWDVIPCDGCCWNGICEELSSSGIEETGGVGCIY